MWKNIRHICCHFLLPQLLGHFRSVSDHRRSSDKVIKVFSSQQFGRVYIKVICISLPSSSYHNHFSSLFNFSQLRILQNHHVRICRSVELLNDSFGTILLLEMFFIFTCFTNYLIKILVIFPTASTYNKISMITLLFGITGNLAMICNSAELIRSKVLDQKKKKMFLIFKFNVASFYSRQEALNKTCTSYQSKIHLYNQRLHLKN